MSLTWKKTNNLTLDTYSEGWQLFLITIKWKACQRMLWSFLFDSRVSRFTALKDEKGYYVIDRDGAYFAPILEFLRTGDFFIPEGASLLKEVLLHD